MTDVVDKANAQAQLILAKQIELSRRQPLIIYPNVSGHCWECNAPVADSRRWCSKECTESAERSGW